MVMEIRAEANYIRIAPRKVRRIAGLIKGMNVLQAKLELDHLPGRAGLPIGKLLRSAIANATNNFSLESSRLFVKDVRVNAGPVLKRTRARAFGRAAMITKRMSHVSLCLVTQDEIAMKKGNLDVDRGADEARVINPDEVKKEGKIAGRRATKKSNTSGKEKGFVKKVFNRKAI